MAELYRMRALSSPGVTKRKKSYAKSYLQEATAWLPCFQIQSQVSRCVPNQAATGVAIGCHRPTDHVLSAPV